MVNIPNKTQPNLGNGTKPFKLNKNRSYQIKTEVYPNRPYKDIKKKQWHVKRNQPVISETKPKNAKPNWPKSI
jgi:hypothetical protein